ncbi:uncharacterized protein LOC111396858 isoform X4 [Olea europaea var. sylvestris]|uniref:uncharacterized protein LOC111396858 isoform X4 n=1 Tax=Olea europaea var. sylvestris TaxID=158386 RepID=UPI000C1D0E18|nr:uncharacterized protein LOC111396858 isoform X4 [Olea europaea var. sylvestris]
MQGVGPNLAISFSVYDTVRSYWHYRRPDDSTGLVSLACGSLSGIASSTAVFNAFDAEKQVEVQASLSWLCYSWLILGESSSAVTKL